jgi:hypothetical protein
VAAIILDPFRKKIKTQENNCRTKLICYYAPRVIKTSPGYIMLLGDVRKDLEYLKRQKLSTNIPSSALTPTPTLALTPTPTLFTTGEPFVTWLRH